MPSPVVSGIDTLLARKSSFAGARIGMVTNDAAITGNGIRSRVALLREGFRLVKIFSPEHGIRVRGEDGVAQDHGVDVITGLPLVSLYSDKLGPAEADLAELDLVLFDVPDVGCRFYTYLWTMTYVMEACAAFNKPLIVLDRPNPIGALIEHAEGPMLDEGSCSSFIGRWNIPLKHSCTLGELALYFATTRMPELQVEVIKVQNYSRYHTALHDFAFVPTSPAIQNINAAMLYPGSGLWEGIMVNEGRGTNSPFEQMGAPWIRSEEFCRSLNERLTGVEISPVEFVPKTGVYEGETCHGVSFRIRGEDFKAVQSGLIIIETIFESYPHVEERLYKTHANPSGAGHMDKLLGQSASIDRLKTKEGFGPGISQYWHSLIRSSLLYV